MNRANFLTWLQAKFPKLSMANVTNSDVQDAFTNAAGFSEPAQSSVVPVATTGVQLSASDEYVIVVSANVAHIVLLPAVALVSPGKRIRLEAGAVGFALSTGAVGDLLNGLAASVGVKSAAIPATGLALCTAVSAAETGTVGGWLLQYTTELGAIATAIVPA